MPHVYVGRGYITGCRTGASFCAFGTGSYLSTLSSLNGQVGCDSYMIETKKKKARSAYHMALPDIIFARGLEKNSETPDTRNPLKEKTMRLTSFISDRL